MRVSELMTRSVRRALVDEAVAEVRDRLQADDIRHLPVLDAAGRVVGMLSDRDVFRARGLPLPPKVVEEIMSKHVHTIGPDTSAAEAGQLMLDLKIDALPVVADGKLVGMVTTTDFLSLACRLLRQGR